MNTRIGFLKLATFVAVAAAALAPATAQAQAPKNRGQLVQAIVKLNQAQLAFAKKLAEDTQFAAQFDKATATGNYDAAASLAASVSGLSKSEVSVGSGPLGGDDSYEAASESTKSVYQLASFSPRKERKPLSGKICFDVVIAHGCIAF
jgi:hypothetical protein